MVDEQETQSEPTGEQPQATPPEESIEQPAVQEQTEQTSPDAPQAEPETESTPSPETPPAQQMDVDEMGVPWKNRYHESQRKLDKVLEQQDALLQKVDQTQGQKGGEYSIEELEAFAETTDNDGHRRWAKSEIRKLQKEESTKVIRTEIDTWKQEQMAEKTRSDALQTVMSRHPSAFKKNAQGQFTGWDANSPLAQSIAQYMQDPEIKDNPRGLLVATAMAFQDVAAQTTTQAAAKVTKLNSEKKDLQKKTLTEGGGVSSPPASKTPTSAAKEKLATSGSIKDGAAAMKEILKSRGRIKED